jgi:hypothetical protein
MTDQLSLTFDASISERFEEFHKTNPHVYRTLVRLAREWIHFHRPQQVDHLCQAPSNAGGLQSIAEAYAALDSLIAENAKLRNDLASAQQARDTAQTQVAHYRTHYSRTGW